MHTKYFYYKHPFELESGETLPELTIAYHTYGRLNADRSNCIWVMHALTANSEVADWWPHTVEEGKFLDPAENFIVCANVIGSCYGSTGPVTPLGSGFRVLGSGLMENGGRCGREESRPYNSPNPEPVTPNLEPRTLNPEPGTQNPEPGTPLYAAFPLLTVRDMVKAHQLLADHLGIRQIDTIIGSSLGGFQALEWLVEKPEIARKAVLCATDYQCRPWLAAINKAMYMAIEADPTYGEPRPDAARKGLEAARAIALLSYRSHAAYDRTQADEDRDSKSPFERRVHSYQAYQGKKLADRFDVYSYERMCRSSDTHDVGRGRGGAAAALGRIKAKCLVISVSSDILFPPSYHEEMAAMIPGAETAQIVSDYAHDGFLIEHEQLDRLIRTFRG